MKYGQIAGSNRVNELIYHCFSYISDENERKFVKKFREQPHESEQIMHTVRELILGAYLGSKGFKIKYDCVVNNHTPDWCILDVSLATCCIVELFNFHIDKNTETDIEKQRQAKCVASYWRDGNKNNTYRLYESFRHKSQVYQNLVEHLKLPYVIALFSNIGAAIDLEEVQSCLFEDKTGLFTLYPSNSGVLFFEENGGQYSFIYINNPNAQRSFDIPNGVLSQ